jgi:hypothetical protein
VRPLRWLLERVQRFGVSDMGVLSAMMDFMILPGAAWKGKEGTCTWKSWERGGPTMFVFSVTINVLR